MDGMAERWLPIKGFYGAYEVSDVGRVRSLARTKKSRWPGIVASVQEKILKPRIGHRGHHFYTLQADGKFRLASAHHLVLETFVGRRPKKKEGCHNDGDPGNNRRENLRWDTRAGNAADQKAHGTCMYGSKNPATSLTEKKVAQLKHRIRNGEKPAILAREFGIGSSTAYRIRDGLNWGRVP